MTHHFHLPSFPLNQFISGFVYYKGFTANHTIDRYLPNGNTEIIINLTDTPKHIYNNQSLTETQTCKKLWISGIRNGFISIPSGTGAEMFIIEFKKGMAYPFLNMPLTEITDKVVEGDLILNPVFMEMREKLLECKSVSDMFYMVEAMLFHCFRDKLVVNPFIDFAVKGIMANPAGATIKSIADKTGYSSKHLIKIFNDNVGINPSRFCGLSVFRKPLTKLRHTAISIGHR